jgi:allophanate hydrolase
MTESIDISSAPAAGADGLGSLQLGSLAAAYRTGALDPRELATLVHARALARQSDNAWIHLREADELVGAAADLIRRWPDPGVRPLLFGVPVAIKDNIDVAGLPTTAGCPDFSYLPAVSAALVERLVGAGALVVGKSNLDQFATGLTGTRTPYGICTSPFDSSRVSGGSSSGSAVVVSTGIVSFSIGTDTAGSGRVPAAFSNIVGLKPSRGLVSGRGMVPACRSLDCASVFALSVTDAWTVLRVIAEVDPFDPWSRSFTTLPANPVLGIPQRIGVPRIDQLEPVDPMVAAAFAAAVEALAAAGHRILTIDVEPFLAAGSLMYDGPWVAERLASLEGFLTEQPGSLFPVVREVLLAATSRTAADAFRGIHELAELAAKTAPVWSSIDVLVMPTVPSSPKISDALIDAHGVNASLGRFTTFCNLLDLAALSVPSELSLDGQPVGITCYGPSGSDAVLAGLGAVFHATSGLPAGATGLPVLGLPAVASGSQPAEGYALLAVAGAHRTGHPLHPQLVAIGGSYRETTWTTDSYRMYALPSAGVPRPGLVKVASGGAPIEVELHSVPIAGLGALLVQIPAPLALGRVDLSDGRQVTGFVCEAYASAGGTDVTEYGSWPAYLAVVPPG